MFEISNQCVSRLKEIKKNEADYEIFSKVQMNIISNYKV
jgi:hypothetical protein